MGFLGSLEKMSITAFKDSGFKSKVGEPFSVYINPEKYSRTYYILYSDIQPQGSSSGTPEFNRTKSDQVNFELVFDGTGVVPSKLPGVAPFTGDGIAEQIDAFLRLVFDFNGNIHSPNFLQISWGTLLFNCRLSKLTINYTLFKPDGTPLRAKADASFVEYTNKVELAKEENKTSPDLSHVVTVKAGQTLPLMCFEIYGSSAYYTQVARANGLTDFRDLTPGSKILFPPLREAAE